MKFYLVILFLIISNCSLLYGQSWSILPVSFPYSIRAIDFSDNDHGYIACTNNKIYKTSDGGFTWTDVSPNFTAGTSTMFIPICTLDSLTAFAGSGNFNTIIRTYDGGITWDSVSVPIWQTMEIQFINDTTGFAQGMAGFFRTYNRGITWSQLATSTRMGGLYFITDSLAFSGGSNKRIYKTTDQGLTWTLQNTKLNEGAQGVYFFDANHGIAVDGDGYWSITYNQGTSWNLYSHSSHMNQVGIHFVNSSLGFKICSNCASYYYITNDGGITWTNVPNPTGSGSSDMDFPSECVGYISTLNGIILKYTDPGCLTSNIGETSGKDLISIYPNPVGDRLNLNFKSNQTAEFFLYDISSRQLINHVFSGSTIVNTTRLSRGLYLYEIRSNNQVFKKGKVVKE